MQGNFTKNIHKIFNDIFFCRWFSDWTAYVASACISSFMVRHEPHSHSAIVCHIFESFLSLSWRLVLAVPTLSLLSISKVWVVAFIATESVAWFVAQHRLTVTYICILLDDFKICFSSYFNNCKIYLMFRLLNSIVLFFTIDVIYAIF